MATNHMLETMVKLTDSLSYHLLFHHPYVSFHDINLGARKLCGNCGRTMEVWEQSSSQHMPWCRYGMAIKAIEEAKFYTAIVNSIDTQS